jgi:hypothetical protein
MSTSGPLALAPELDELRRQFEAIAAEAAALVTPLSEEQFHWKPSGDRWSIAECLEHLNATARHYLPAIDDGIGDAIRLGTYGEGPFEYRWYARLLVRVIEPPPVFRLKATQQILPASDRPKQATANGFGAYQVQYVDRLRQSNGIDLATARVRSPMAAWLRIPLGCGFAAMVAHERRHLWQARQVRDAPGFPPA